MHDEVGCLQGAQGVQRQLPGVAAAGIDHDEVAGVKGRDRGRCDRRLFCGALFCGAPGRQEGLRGVMAAGRKCRVCDVR